MAKHPKRTKADRGRAVLSGILLFALIAWALYAILYTLPNNLPVLFSDINGAIGVGRKAGAATGIILDLISIVLLIFFGRRLWRVFTKQVANKSRAARAKSNTRIVSKNTSKHKRSAIILPGLIILASIVIFISGLYVRSFLNSQQSAHDRSVEQEPCQPILAYDRFPLKIKETTESLNTFEKWKNERDSVNIFIADGSQLNDKSEPYEKNQIVVEAPPYFISSIQFVDKVKPYLDSREGTDIVEAREYITSYELQVRLQDAVDSYNTEHPVDVSGVCPGAEELFID